ncbi:hypothetical protein A3860_05285 [Niastella vici]|uniref:DUF7151 domain-containing protein n=2 Tax=Niastella vici TaxID=1703345 RepID=A0A1V9FS16_9BACT|nr:hypothetical protein A3860_05285 [Niastella vici]
MVFLCATLLVISCSKDGSNGKDGTNGTNGKTALTKTTKEPAGANCKYGGTKFETGIDANNNGILDSDEVTTTQTKYVCDGAGAIYSSWIDVNVSDTLTKLNEEKNFYFKQLLPATALTADIVNKGIVLMYYKNINGVIYPVDRDPANTIRDTDSTGNDFVFGPGFVFKEKYLSFLVSGWNMMDKINGNGSAVRYVLIPGMVQGRSIADVKKMPYSKMAKLYNIED